MEEKYNSYEATTYINLVGILSPECKRLIYIGIMFLKVDKIYLVKKVRFKYNLLHYFLTNLRAKIIKKTSRYKR